MTRQGTLLILASLGALAAAYAGCGADSASNGAASGATGPGGSGASSTVVASSSASTGVTASTGGTGVDVGGPCKVDSDCGADLRCSSSGSDEPVFHGGPANGYCTRDCASDNDCPGTSLCFLDGAESGVCAEFCKIGPDLMYLDDPLDPAKCHGRADSRCVDLTGGSVCLPTCGSDAQCDGGRVCDPRYAVCVGSPHAGAPDGSKCDPQAADPGCEGVCLSIQGGTAMCSNYCVLGMSTDDLNLGSSLNCGGPTAGLCIYRPKGFGAGDQGYCAPACTAQADCQLPDFFCYGIKNLTPDIVPNGFCLNATPCKDDSECGGLSSCHDTPYGMRCLDPAFPFDGAGGGGGGSASAGAGGSGGAGGAAVATSASTGP